MRRSSDVAAMQSPQIPVVEARGLSKSFRRGSEEIHALVGVELSVQPGELVALVGPSGSGKTTLLNVLAGWEHAESGELYWGGSLLTTSPATLGWREIAIVPQSLGLMDELTLTENVHLPLRLSGDPDAARADELISDLGLSSIAGRLPDETSLGEQQRTAVARALVGRPRLLMADEPTAHQDALWNRKVLEAIRSAAVAGSACIVASHHRETVEHCDRVIGIRDGEVRHVEELSTLVLKEEH
jgi:ABC-type lipoprotein export system ATPase subunit